MLEIWHTLEGRLRWAIDQQPHKGRQQGLRLFQRKIEGRANELRKEGGPALPGTGLSSIQTYLNGKTVPPVSFLREAASVLGVDGAWLILGDGAPTRAHAVAAGISSSSLDSQRDLALNFERAILEKFDLTKATRPEHHPSVQLPDGPSDWESPSCWVAPLREVWLRLRACDMMLDPRTTIVAARGADESTDRTVEAEIGTAVRAPFDVWSVDPARVGTQTLADYVLALVPALLLLAGERNRQRLEDVGGSAAK